MTTYRILITGFERYLTEYIQQHGEQTVMQIKELAKQYSITSRNGAYDITARKRYHTIFMTYCMKNNLQEPEEWNIIGHSVYDPDNEFPNDPDVLRLKRMEKQRLIDALLSVQDNPEDPAFLEYIDNIRRR